MDIIRYTSRCESGSEIVKINFPDSLSQGSRENHRDSPRATWIKLADEKARLHNISFVYDLTKDGLEVEFLSPEDADAIFNAMAPEWQQRLIESFGYLLRFTLNYYESPYSENPPEPESEMRYWAELYDIPLKVMLDYYPDYRDYVTLDM